ncbi:MAG: prolipoprotein diacylglyceryl transferase [Bacteroidetes bacterium]|nr:prolipoprotein diacylglyceryl transferase [Bacteroidota bacterium]
MIPVLFHIGPISVYSFGLMMGIAFLVANYFFAKEMGRRGLPEQAAGTVTILALVGGVAGSKLFSLLENFDRFLADPVGEMFSSAGLTFYGGLILATLLIFLYIRSKKLSFRKVADAAAPALILAYGIGRIGCQLAGDGDYGIPSDLPWAMTYPRGTVSTIVDSAYAHSQGIAPNTELAEKFRQMYPNRPMPPDIPVHPAPVYETLMALGIFYFLWRIRTRPMPAGKLFSIYLILAGVERLLVEFIRLNPLYLGLSQAQWISIGMMGCGGIFLYLLRNSEPERFEPRTQMRTPRPGDPKRRNT